MPMIDTVATGKNIKDMATKHGMRAQDIQTVFGFGTPQTVFKWFRGATMPSIDNMVVLAKIFNATVDDILVVI